MNMDYKIDEQDFREANEFSEMYKPTVNDLKFSYALELIFGKRNAKKILETFGYDVADMFQRRTLFQSTTTPKAYDKLVAIDVIFRQRSNTKEKQYIRSSIDCYKYLMNNCYKEFDTEHFFVVMLNRAHQVLGHVMLSKGGTSATVVDNKILFSILLRHGASVFMISHNHPSGNVRPSGADIELTNNIVDAAIMLNMSCLDHIIIGSHYFSFADEGIMKTKDI